MIVELNNPIELWRYDLAEPCEQWDSNTHSLEYTYLQMPEHLRYKNQIGTFYFFDNRDQALNTGRIACDRSGLHDLWLTNTNLNMPITLLDLRKSMLDNGELSLHDHPVHIIDHLIELGLDVLSDDFKKYINQVGDSIPFSVMRNNYETFKSIQGPDITDADRHIKQTLAKDFNDFFIHPDAWNLAYLGQLLTDFENGIVFKNFLQRIGCAGYIFDEAPNTPTYCILDSHNLSLPQKEHIQ